VTRVPQWRIVTQYGKAPGPSRSLLNRESGAYSPAVAGPSPACQCGRARLNGPGGAQLPVARPIGPGNPAAQCAMG
jgi:hypothetical protein